jgi:hypothetical protein
METIMEAFLRGWDNGRKRRSGRLAMTAIATPDHRGV